MSNLKHKHVSQVWPQRVGKANLHLKEGALFHLSVRTWASLSWNLKWFSLVVNHSAHCISSLPYFSAINQTQTQGFHKLSNRVNASWPLENTKANVQFSNLLSGARFYSTQETFYLKNSNSCVQTDVLLGQSITLSRTHESQSLVINDKYGIIPSALRSEFCTEIIAALKGKVSLPLLMPQAFVLFS